MHRTVHLILGSKIWRNAIFLIKGRLLSPGETNFYWLSLYNTGTFLSRTVILVTREQASPLKHRYVGCNGRFNLNQLFSDALFVANLSGCILKRPLTFEENRSLFLFWSSVKYCTNIKFLQVIHKQFIWGKIVVKLGAKIWSIGYAF